MPYSAAPYTSRPYQAVVFIVVTHADGSLAQGSGVMVSANEVLTAAHVISGAVSVKVSPGSSGSATPYGTITASSWTAFEDLTGEALISTAQTQADLGLVRLPTRVGDATGWFGITPDYAGGTVTISGYPAAFGATMETETAAVTRDSLYANLDYPAGTVLPGNSGGPLWIGGASAPSVVGVVSTTIAAPLITASTYQRIRADIDLWGQTLQGGYDFSVYTLPLTVNFITSTASNAVSSVPIAHGGPNNLKLNANTLIGTGADDLFIAGESNGYWNIDGRGGHDVIEFRDPRDSYRTATVGLLGQTPPILYPSGEHVASIPGTTMDGAYEEVRFIDGSVNFDSGSNAFKVLRLYQATFGRDADALGMGYWAGQLDAGTLQLGDVAMGFVTSAEFGARYPGQTNQDFVTQLYANVLQRAPDAAGAAAWTSALAGGGASRAAVLVGFSESPEFVGRVAAFTPGGVWQPNEAAASVARLYYSALGRAPDHAGESYWLTFLTPQFGKTLGYVAQQFIASQEFQAKFGVPDNGAFVDLLYSNVLGRSADAGGRSYWVQQLGGGVDRAAVLVGFSESTEHKVQLVPVIEQGGIQFAA